MANQTVAIDYALVSKCKKLAKESGRTLKGQIQWLIEKALKAA